MAQKTIVQILQASFVPKQLCATARDNGKEMAERVDKIAWSGTLVAIQPRIRLLRSFDQRDHAYLGYSLRVDGIIGEGRCEFTVGIGKATQAAHGLRAGDAVEGLCSSVPNPELEPVEFYKVSKFRVRIRGTETPLDSTPWGGRPPALEVYRERGHRRLAPQTYDANCTTCIWGCRMAVEMIIDHWNPSQRRYRHETFCYCEKKGTVLFIDTRVNI